MATDPRNGWFPRRGHLLALAALLLTVGPMLVVGTAASPAEAATGCVPTANQVALFVDRSYGGDCVTFDVGAHPNVAAAGFPDNAVSSLRSGANVIVVVHQDADFGGASNHSWQSMAANDANLGDNLYHELQSPPDNAGRIEDSVSALWVMRKSCVPGPTEVAVFHSAGYGGACTSVGSGAYPSTVLAGIPPDFVGSLKVGTATRVTIWADPDLVGPSCTYNAGANRSSVCVGNNEVSSLLVGNDTTPPSVLVTHVADGQDGWNLGGPVGLSITAIDAESDLAGPPTCTDNGDAVTVTGSAPTLSAEVSGPGGHAVTCSARDTYGNTGTGSDTVKIDGAPPSSLEATATAGNGSYSDGAWTNHDVVVTFTCVDAISGVGSVTPRTTITTEGTGQSVPGTCVDKAGNSATTTFGPILIDKSLPVITAQRVPEPAPGGWDTTDVTVTFACDDTVSGVAELTDPITVSTEGADQSVTGTCTDEAGNRATLDVGGIYIDTDDPAISASATAGNQSYERGTWTNDDVVVTFECTDTGSGVASVTPPVTVGADGTDQSVTGTCTDDVGRSASRTFDDIDIDRTAPTIAVTTIAGGEPYTPGTWTDQSVTVTFACEDAVSGVATVSDPVTVSTEGTDQSVTGTCTDRAGNTATATATNIDVDKDAPTLVASATAGDDPYDAGTWTSGDVIVTFTCTDEGTGVGSVTPPVTVSTEGANQSVTGTCIDNAGRSTSRTFDDIDVDKTAPTIAVTTTAGGQPYTPGTWSDRDVTVTFACDDPVSGVAELTDPITVSTEGADQSVSGACTDRTGNSVSATATGINIDRNAPELSVSATAGGEPYQAGTWTTADVVVSFACTDVGTGVASVTPPVTVTAEGADQSVTGTCTDNAGRSSTTTLDDIRIDRSVPAISAAMTVDGEPYTSGDWTDDDVVVTFVCDDTVSGVAELTDPVTVSTPGADQSVTGTCTDRAGNSVSVTATGIFIDAGGPELAASATVGGQPYQAGTWSKADVVVTFTCTDTGSGVASVTPPVTVTAEGPNQSVSGTCTNNAGASTTRVFDDIDIDETAPALSTSTTADGDPYTPGTWTGHDVRVAFDCTDALSGVGSVTSPVTLSTEGGGQSTSGNCTDRAGNFTSATATGMNIDKQDPNLSASATAGDQPYEAGTWSNTNVVVTFSCTDAGSGVAAVTGPVTVSTEGANQSVTGTCRDNAGRATSRAFDDIDIDVTVPAVAYTGNAGTYIYGDPISIDCSATDALSSIAQATCDDITGPLPVGTHNFSASAVDRAGNSAAASTTVTITPRLVESAASGNWSAPGTWSSGQAPGPNDIVTVAGGHTVTVDAATVSARGVTIRQGATLAFAAESAVTLESSRNVVVEGTLRMRPASPAVIHVLRFVGIDERNFVGGGDSVLESDIGLWVVGAGTLDAVGSPKTSWTRVAAPVAPGATTIELQEPATGWEPGDEIAIAPTEHPGVGNPSWNGFDQRTITAVSGNTVTLSGGTAREHPIVNGVWGAEVMNLTRNVRIEGTPTGRTHVMVTAHVPQTITNVTLRYTGPRKASGNGFTKFVMGRYALHFHMGHHGTQGSVIDGVVVRDGGSHAFVPHTSHGITFRNTIAYNQFEEAYWWDDKAPTHDTTYDHAIAAMLKSDPAFRGYRLSGFELGRGVGNEVRDSVAVGVQGNLDSSGFTWPESANAEPNAWVFTGNVTHNNKVDGIFVWQNTNGPHVVESFVAYRNGQFAIDHGAYVNRYEYRDGVLFENARGGIKQRANSRDAYGALTFTRMTITGSPVSVLVAEHNVSQTVPAVYRDCAFSQHTSVPIEIAERTASGLYDFINCDLEPSDFQLTSALQGMRIRVQRTDRTAFQIDANGTVTVIPRFEPPDVPPTVALTSPADGTTFTQPATVTISATAADVDGSIGQVEFFAGATSLGVVTAGPYSMTWENVPAGTHTIFAVATDNDSAKTLSAPVTITVDPP